MKRPTKNQLIFREVSTIEQFRLRYDEHTKKYHNSPLRIYVDKKQYKDYKECLGIPNPVQKITYRGSEVLINKTS